MAQLPDSGQFEEDVFLSFEVTAVVGVFHFIYIRGGKHMFEKIKKIIFDRERSIEEYKIVVQVLEKTNLYILPPEGTDVREFDYQQLKKLPGILWKSQEENEALMQEVRMYKENTENVSSAIDTILDTVEKRYGIKGSEEAIET